MLLNLLTSVLEVLAGTMSRATTCGTEDECHRGKQQQNYSFNHNRSVFLVSLRMAKIFCFSILDGGWTRKRQETMGLDPQRARGCSLL
jgi:hypothetical protein